MMKEGGASQSSGVSYHCSGVEVVKMKELVGLMMMVVGGRAKLRCVPAASPSSTCGCAPRYGRRNQPVMQRFQRPIALF